MTRITKGDLACYQDVYCLVEDIRGDLVKLMPLYMVDDIGTGPGEKNWLPVDQVFGTDINTMMAISEPNFLDMDDQPMTYRDDLYYLNFRNDDGSRFEYTVVWWEWWWYRIRHFRRFRKISGFRVLEEI